MLDYIRAYDLNDYALGASFSASQEPYVGGGSSVILYPYLTSFQHSAFTRDWFLLQGENFGVRFVTDSEWEIGAVARVQTLGFGGIEDDELRGMDPRRWTIEAGPLIGLRRWPVHLQARSYWELLDRHGGMTAELELSVPQQFDWGYIVPSVRFEWQSDEYSQYYFGVADYEARPSRPAYRPGSSLNTRAGVELGYRLSPRWLLSTTIGIEYLDSNIVDSPIVDQETLWSASVGLAYNADIFQPTGDSGDHGQRFDMRFSGMRSSSDSIIVRDSALGEPGDEIDLEDIFGIANEETVFLVDTYLRLDRYHRFELNYFELQRSSTAILENGLDIGDKHFPAGSDINVNSQTRVIRFAWSYSLMRDKQKELGVTAGISRTSFETDISSDLEQLVEGGRVKVMVPTIGAFGSLTLGEKWLLSVDLNGFALEFDRYDGYMAYANANLDRRFGSNLRVGLGYSFFGSRLVSKHPDTNGEFRFRHYGPRLSVSLAF